MQEKTASTGWIEVVEIKGAQDALLREGSVIPRYVPVHKHANAPAQKVQVL